MNTMDENNLTEVPEDQHILDTKNTKKRDKKGENISFKNLKSSIIFKASSNSKKKLNHKLKQPLPNSNPKKKVKFNDDIIIIDIESDFVPLFYQSDWSAYGSFRRTVT